MYTALLSFALCFMKKCNIFGEKCEQGGLLGNNSGNGNVKGTEMDSNDN